jgi:hypothetical protein
MDELHVKQHTITDGQATCIKERAKHAQPLSHLSSNLVGVCCPGPCEKSPQDTVLFQTTVMAVQKTAGLGFWMSLTVLLVNVAGWYHTKVVRCLELSLKAVHHSFCFLEI